MKENNGWTRELLLERHASWQAFVEDDVPLSEAVVCLCGKVTRYINQGSLLLSQAQLCETPSGDCICSLLHDSRCYNVVSICLWCDDYCQPHVFNPAVKEHLRRYAPTVYRFVTKIKRMYYLLE